MTCVYSNGNHAKPKKKKQVLSIECHYNLYIVKNFNHWARWVEIKFCNIQFFMLLTF